jgi:beta-glucanase (GH16 family)
MLQLLRALFGDTPPGVAQVAAIRRLCPGFDDQPLDEAVRRTLAARDQTIADLRAEVEQSNRTWQQVSIDDFSGAMPPTWYAYARSRGNRGVGWRDPSTVSVGNGELVITAHGDTSGAVGHTIAQQYGRWEVRAKFDDCPDHMPCILLWPYKEQDPPGTPTWPRKKEYDLVECGGARDRGYCNVHHGETDTQTGPHWFTGDLTQWHIYACELMADYVAFFFDDVEVERLTDPDVLSTFPHRIGIQLDVREGANNPDAASKLHVDSVRVLRPAA